MGRFRLYRVEFVIMTGRNYRGPEHHASAGLPVSILLLSVLAISAYLLVGASLTGERASPPRSICRPRKHKCADLCRSSGRSIAITQGLRVARIDWNGIGNQLLALSKGPTDETGANATPASVVDGGIQAKLLPAQSGIYVWQWRPRPELNRGTRICSPLRHHSATRPL